MGLLDRHRRVPTLQLPFSRRDRVVRRGKCRCHYKVLESGRREYEEIVIRAGAGVPQLVRNVSRGHETITLLEYEYLVSDDHFQFSGGHVVRFILTRMRVTGHADSGGEARLQEAIRSSRIRARQTDGADAHVKIPALGSWLMFYSRRSFFRVDSILRSFVDSNVF